MKSIMIEQCLCGPPSRPMASAARRRKRCEAKVWPSRPRIGSHDNELTGLKWPEFCGSFGLRSTARHTARGFGRLRDTQES
jgi:hypothetical protein